MKEYKVIPITYWWSVKHLAKKSQDTINMHVKDGWKFLNLQYRPWGMCAMITFVKEN